MTMLTLQRYWIFASIVCSQLFSSTTARSWRQWPIMPVTPAPFPPPGRDLLILMSSVSNNSLVLTSTAAEFDCTHPDKDIILSVNTLVLNFPQQWAVAHDELGNPTRIIKNNHDMCAMCKMFYLHTSLVSLDNNNDTDTWQIQQTMGHNQTVCWTGQGYHDKIAFQACNSTDANQQWNFVMLN